MKKLKQMISSDTDIYSIDGFLKAFQLYDVLFIYRGSMLFQYKGVFGGWEFYSSIEIPTKELALKYVDLWAKGEEHQLSSFIDQVVPQTI